MKLAVIGSAGQLGTDLVKRMAVGGFECVPLTHDDVEVTDLESVRAALTRSRPDVVVNTAAFHQVDLCEDEPEKTLLVNAGGARNVGVVCSEIGAVNVYISTDYVFDGAQLTPYRESDAPNPLSVYGCGKLAAEHMARLTGERHFVVRSTGLYGLSPVATGKGGNFVETVLRFVTQGKRMNVVSDQFVTPTSTADLAKKLLELIRTERFGLYHITNNDECSWYEFARRVAELSGLEHDIGETTTAEFGARARRPAYSVLDNHRLREAGLSDMRPWQEALAAHMEKRMRL